MRNLANDFLTKAQVDGLKELIDLCTNGYQVLFGATLYTSRIYHLKHSHNGRRLSVDIGRYYYEIKESGRRVKLVAYNSDGTIVQP